MTTPLVSQEFRDVSQRCADELTSTLGDSMASLQLLSWLRANPCGVPKINDLVRQCAGDSALAGNSMSKILSNLLRLHSALELIPPEAST